MFSGVQNATQLAPASFSVGLNQILSLHRMVSSVHNIITLLALLATRPCDSRAGIAGGETDLTFQVQYV